MAKLEMEIDEALRKMLEERARERGESEEAVVEEALRRYLSREPAVLAGGRPPRITDPARAEEILQRTAGLWADRTDLPDRGEMNREWDERLERLFGNG